MIPLSRLTTLGRECGLETIAADIAPKDNSARIERAREFVARFRTGFRDRGGWLRSPTRAFNAQEVEPMRITRWSVLLVLFATLTIAAAPASAQQQKPNILVIM